MSRTGGTVGGGLSRVILSLDKNYHALIVLLQ